jgi:hypothetical protein
LAAAPDAVGTGAGTITIIDLATVAEATKIDDFINSELNAGFQISDIPANISSAPSSLLSKASNVTSMMTVAEAASATPGTYNLSDSAANLAGAAAVGDGALAITATTSATVAEATIIDGFSNNGQNFYRLSDTAANLALAPASVGNGAGEITATDSATNRVLDNALKIFASPHITIFINKPLSRDIDSFLCTFSKSFGSNAF